VNKTVGLLQVFNTGDQIHARQISKVFCKNMFVAIRLSHTLQC